MAVPAARGRRQQVSGSGREGEITAIAGIALRNAISNNIAYIHIYIYTYI